MGIMKIKVDAPPVTFAFEWEGGAGEIESVMTFIDNLAAEAKVTPEQLTLSALKVLPQTGLLEGPGRQPQLMAILYVVLSAPAKSPGRPGAVYRYAADEETTAVLTVKEHEVHIDMSGQRMD